SDSDGPMAGAAHVGRAAALEALHGADLVALVVVLAVGRLDELLKDIVEPFILEVALLLGHPFLQAEVWLDHEFFLECFLGHGSPPSLVMRTISSSLVQFRRRDARRRAARGSSSRARPSAAVRPRRRASR